MQHADRSNQPLPSADRGSDAPPVIALHSSASSGRQWEAWRKHVRDGVQIIAPDLFGYGSLPQWTLGATTSLAAEADAVAAAVQLPSRERGVHLMGHSYGGAVAIELALRYPGSILSVTLYEPVRFGILRENDERQWSEIQHVAQETARLTRAGQWREAGAVFVDYWSGRGTWEILSLARQVSIAACMPKVCADFDALFSDRTPLEAYRSLSMPIRLLRGTRSPAPAQRVADRLGELIPSVQSACLEGLGHMAPVQHPEHVIAATGWAGAAVA